MINQPRLKPETPDDEKRRTPWFKMRASHQWKQALSNKALAAGKTNSAFVAMLVDQHAIPRNTRAQQQRAKLNELVAANTQSLLHLRFVLQAGFSDLVESRVEAVMYTQEQILAALREFIE